MMKHQMIRNQGKKRMRSSGNSAHIFRKSLLDTANCFFGPDAI